jgi:hypothetical protein
MDNSNLGLGNKRWVLLFTITSIFEDPTATLKVEAVDCSDTVGLHTLPGPREQYFSNVKMGMEASSHNYTL